MSPAALLFDFRPALSAPGPLRRTEVSAPRLDIQIPEMWPTAVEARAFEILQREEARLEPDDDDLACADEFPVPTASTRSRALAVAERIARAMCKDPSGFRAPRFISGGDGGVGLHWRNDRLELLVSVPVDRSSPILFYGDTPSGSWIKGSLSQGAPVGALAEWIVEHDRIGRRDS